MKKRPFYLFQSIYFKIPLLFVFILLIAFQFIGIFFIDRLETQSVNSFKNQINNQASFLTNNLAPIMGDDNLTEPELNRRITQTLTTFSSTNPTRIWVINPQETIIASDQNFQQSQVGTQTTNPTIRNVLVSHNTYAGELVDAASNQPIYQLIMPILSPDQSQLLGAVAIEADMGHIYTQTNEIIDLFIQSAALAIGIALVISVVLSQGLTRPIETIRQQAIRISEGVYNYPAPIYGRDELGELTLTVNDLAQRVQDAQESTESERQRLDSVLRHMRDGVIGTDRRGNIILVNDRALYLLNIQEKTVNGRSILDVLGIRDDYNLVDFMKEDMELMIRWVNRDLETVLKCEFSVIRRDTGFISGLVCVLTDVTEQEKTDQERRDFVSNVSHELRTPLTSVKSYSEALIDGAWQDPSIAPQFLETIQMESNRMIRMVTNLLDLSKIDSGQIVLDTDYVDFKRVVDRIVNRAEFMLTTHPQEKAYHINREYTSRDVYVDIDQDRITQVIENLINNAMKYSPDGGMITVRIEDMHDALIFRVKDQGLGISQYDIQHLFERFYRVDKARSREQGGSGLGLAISKEVIELHGGRIWVESEEGQGSTFSFSLPYVDFDIQDEWGDFDAE